MNVLPVDLVALVGTIMGISIVLFPVIGLTARFALKPTVEAFGRFFEHKELDETVHILERRMTLLEQQIQSLESSIQQVVEATEFHNALRSGPPQSLGSGSEASDTARRPAG